MAYRPSWQGHLKLSLVTCPVALYIATNSGSDVHFHLINPATNDRIKMITTDPDSGPVERSELVKGYEISKGEYVILTDEEIKSVRLESTRTIDIERFVPESEIDRIYWDNPYFLAPDGEMAQEAFNVIRAAMEKSGQIALGRIVIATRERLPALEPRGKGILAYTIRSDAEVRKPDEIFASITDAEPDPEMISIAEKIIDQREGPFDPSQFVDRYEEALKKLITDKQKGRKVTAVEEGEPTNVVDLMAALRASLAGKDKGERKPARKPKPAAKKPTKPRARQASWGSVGPAGFAVGIPRSDHGCGGFFARLHIALLRGRPRRVEFLLLTTQIGLFPLASIVELGQRRLRGIKPGAIGRRPSDGFRLRLRRFWRRPFQGGHGRRQIRDLRQAGRLEREGIVRSHGAPQQSPRMLQGGGNRRLVRCDPCVSRRKQISVRSPRAQRRRLARRGHDGVEEAEQCLENLQLSGRLLRQDPKAPFEACRCRQSPRLGAPYLDLDRVASGRCRDTTPEPIPDDSSSYTRGDATRSSPRPLLGKADLAIEDETSAPGAARRHRDHRQ